MQTFNQIADFIRELNAGTTSLPVRYLAFAGCIVLSFVAAKLLHFIFREVIGNWTRKTKTERNDQFIQATQTPIVWMLAVSGIYFSLRFLHLKPGMSFFLYRVYLGVMILLGLQLMLRATQILSEVLVSVINIKNIDYGDLLANLLRPLFKTILWIIAILMLMKNVFGINIGALLAGAGIVAMAIAFAAQNTIANIFGAVSLIVDRPFRIGDRIQIGDKDGVVETIGLRSTRLRSLDGTVWSIPNRTMTDTPIHNYSERPNFKEVFVITLNYNTTAENLRRGKEILHGILDKHPLFNEKQPPVITFSAMADYSLNLQAVCFFQTTDFGEFVKAKEEINFQILEKFGQAKLDIAFPTQTICLEQSGK